MTAPTPHLADLSADDRRRLESLLLKFEQSWDEKRLSAALRQLPPDSPLRRPALIEMIKIDLERRRKAGQKIRVDAYLKPFPELGTADDLPVDLLLAEYQARRTFGSAVDLAEYDKRFPRQAGELRRLVKEADRHGAEGGESEARMSTLHSDQAKQSTPRPDGGPAAALELPEHFGRYRILKCIGRGGMGAVYLAHDAQLDRQVALKAPHFAAGDGPAVLERFAREARAAAALRHPNVCPVYDVGVHAGVHYVTMAYVEGRPLSDLLRDHKSLPQRPAAAVVRKLALALAEAHRHGVIHRDLKPSNVMVDQRMEPVIMDFGLARQVNKDEERLTKAGAILGTPAYMPPEQVSGDIDTMGPACDIYSLGVMLYEMLTGRPPFRGTLTAVLGQILTKAPEPPSKLRPDLDRDLEAICLKAMAKKPEARFASMEAMADALGRYLKGEAAPATTRPAAAAKARAPAGVKKQGPSEANDLAENLLARLVDRLDTPRPPAAAAPPPPPPPVRGMPWWALPLAALVIVGGLVFGVMALMRFVPSIVVNNANNNANTVAVQLTGLGDRLSDPTLVVLIDGTAYTKEQLAQPVSLTVGKHDLVLKRGDVVVESRQIAVGGEGDKQTVEVPPPGPGQPNGGANPRAPANPKEPVYLKEHTAVVTALAFSPDGKTLYTGSRDNSVLVWDVAAGKKKDDLQHTDNVVWLTVSPDDGALGTGQKDGAVTLWGAGTSKHKSFRLPKELEQGEQLSSFSIAPDAGLVAFKHMFGVVIWDVANQKEAAAIKQRGSYWWGSGDVVPSPDGKTLAVPFVDNDVVLWDLATQKERRLKGHADGVVAVAFSPGGGMIASVSADKTVKLWDAASGDAVANLRGHDQTVWLVQFSADGKTLATCASEGQPIDYGAPGHGSGNSVLKLWDVKARKEILVGQGLKEVSTFHLAPDGKAIAVSAYDKTLDQWKVRLVDVATGEDRAGYKDEHGAGLNMALSSDGVLAWGHRDGTVGLWDVGWKAAAPVKPAPPAGEPSPAVKALLDALQDKDAGVRATAAQQLGDHKDKAVTEALALALADPDNNVTRQAARSLLKLGDPAAVPALVEWVANDRFSADGSGGGKDAALEALRALGSDRATPALVRALKCKKLEVRYWAIQNLAGQKKDKAALEAILPFLKDDDPYCRLLAANALRDLGDPAAAPALMERVADDVWVSDGRGGGKAAALEALRALAQDKVADALQGALKSKTPEVRAWALTELGKEK